jgi:hypothetical protein
VLVAPIAFRYFKAHAAMGLRRTVTDVEHFSADLVGLVTAPDMLWLWNSPPAWNRAEGALYPGVVAVAVVLAGLIAAPRALSPPLPAQMEWMRRVLAAMTIAFAGVTMFVVTGGEFAADVMGVEISVRHGFKPLTMTLLLGSMWLLTSGRMRAAWRSQSALAFYVIATVAMWAFALGPTARLFGERFFYKAPYAWLMLLPGVDTSFRVPARFGMLAALTLSVAVSLALVRLSRTKNARTAGVLIAAVACAVAADSWTRPLQLAVPPRVYRLPDRLPANAAVIELPLGTYEDAAAMYRALTHRRPTVNGLSGYVPPHYEVLYSALSESRVDVLEALAEVAPLVVITHRAQAGELMSSRVRALPSATLLDSDIDRDVVLIPRAPMVPLPGIELTDTVRMQSGHASVSQDTLGLISDRDGTTGWLTPTQQGGEEFVADLGAVQDIDGVVLSLGAFAGGFPRELLVRTSRNGSEWRDAWHGDVSVLAVRAALANQRETPIALPFEARGARYVLVRQVGWSVSPWAVAEFGARGVTRLSRVAR